MTIVATPSTPEQEFALHQAIQKATLALSILDHQVPASHRFDDDPVARTAYLEKAIKSARLALDGWSIEHIVSEVR